MKKKSRLVVHNETSVEHTNEKSGASPYRQYVESLHAEEPAAANPDTLEDTPSNKLWGSNTPPKLAELIIERFTDGNGYFPVLSKRQNDVLRLRLLGMTVTEIGKELKLDKRRVATYLSRIQSRLKRLIKTLDY